MQMCIEIGQMDFAESMQDIKIEECLDFVEYRDFMEHVSRSNTLIWWNREMQRTSILSGLGKNTVAER